jgi:lipoate-protein ligase A
VAPGKQISGDFFLEPDDALERINGALVDALRSQTGLDRAEVIDRMVASFANRYGLKSGDIDSTTVELAEERVASKFGTDDWLNRVP